MKWPAWLNSTVTGAGIASFFGDLGYESVTVLLPSFLIILGAPFFALGFGTLATVNGVGDLVSSVMIGFIWTFIGYSAGFAIAAVIAAAGTILLFWTTKNGGFGRKVSEE